MAAQARPGILPMTTAGTQHFIERTYREGGAFQWVRETYQNAVEARAGRVEFGVEWQAVENLGVYRRTIADDGEGMDPDELVTFFNTFGGGGKPIGGLHENFGVGAKTSLLPWNKCGIVVVSWVDGDPAMIWVACDPDTGEYGLRLFEVDDEETGEVTLEAVCLPFVDEENGCNWADIRPSWLDDHGTVMVLLGNSPTDNTVLGDPNRSESDIKGISAYLNRRLWELPSGLRLTVDELRTQDRSGWPPNQRIGHGPQVAAGADRRTNLRTLMGARHFIEHPGTSARSGRLGHSGTVRLGDETEIDWYLWEGERPAVHSYAAVGGYIAALYNSELYDMTSHQATFRSFGITEQQVRSKVWLIIRPPLADADGRWGVYPRTDRNSLLLRGGPHAGGALPITDWGAQFAELMPDQILKAIRDARTGAESTIEDPSWRERLKERFGSRWRMSRLRARADGLLTVTAAQPGTAPIVRARRARSKHRQKGLAIASAKSGQGGRPSIGHLPGLEPAVEVKVGGALPTYRIVPAADIEAGMLAAWQPNDPEHPEGVVLLNGEHAVLEQVIDHWQSLYPDAHSEEIRKDILAVYGEVAVSKIAHSEFLRGRIPTKVIEDELRSPKSLTMALLGLMAEEAVIAPRLGGKYRRRRIEA